LIARGWFCSIFSLKKKTKKNSHNTLTFTLIQHLPNQKTKQERLAVLERMAAHAQYCLAGDHTLEATQLAAQELAAFAASSGASAPSAPAGGGNGGGGGGGGAGAASSAFLFVISDCNLSRYRLDPAEVGRALTRHPGVRGHVFMIASLGDEAAQVGGWGWVVVWGTGDGGGIIRIDE
jgi:hypothetical protein